MGRRLLLVQSLAVPKPDGSLSAVVVSGGKQYRVAPGDFILVDRIVGEPGSSVKLDRVLLFTNGEEIKVGNPAIEGINVDAKVIAHGRGPRTESIRYKSKKRVRVHRGGRSYLTALEIIAVGGIGVATEEEKDVAKPKGRAKAAPKKKAAPAKAAAVVEEKAEAVEETKAEAPKKATRRRAKKESE
jgi:large subunit ribosomal protein L21